MLAGFYARKAGRDCKGGSAWKQNIAKTNISLNAAASAASGLMLFHN